MSPLQLHLLRIKSCPERTPAGGKPAGGASAVPAGGVVTPAPGRLWAKTPGRHYDRPAGTSPAVLGGPGTGNAHPYLVPSQEARELELSGGVRSLPQVPLVERRQASAPDSGRGGASRIFRGAPCAPLAYRPWKTASAGVPLPFFYLVCKFLPRMNDEPALAMRASSGSFHPGYRIRAVRHRCLTTLARACARGNGDALIRPRASGKGDHAQRGGGGL